MKAPSTSKHGPQAGAPTTRHERAPLPDLVQQLLMGRTEDLAPPQLAAFLDGWSSVLELIRRTDLTIPDASDELRQAVAALVAEIERAQAELLGNPDDR